MEKQETDALVKPDMQAVLSRTHLSVELHAFLLPVFEAISNAMDSIETRFGNESASKGEIQIRFQDANDPHKILISITDNGIGLTDDNYQSFKTPFSGYKLKEKGRGFGRFIAFKIFSRVMYSSRYKFFAKDLTRTFRFDIREKQEFIYFDGEPDFKGEGLCVEYNQPLLPWYELIKSMSAAAIMDEIGNHFLPYFLYRWLPKITIQFNDNPIKDITAYFKGIFVQYDKGEIVTEIDGEAETLTYSLARLPKRKAFKNHCLLFAAADRIVGFPRDLTNILGQPHFIDDKNERYIVIAVVHGEAFEKRLNDARTSIDLSPKVVETIVSQICNAIQTKERTQIDKIKTEQSSGLNEALRENPILRLGLKGKTIAEYVATRPNNWKAEEFVSDLAILRFRASNDLTREIAAAANDPEDYDKKLAKLVKEVDEGQKEALAEYVIHRKNIIALVESSRRYVSDGKVGTEDRIHELVFRRFHDNSNTGYFQHNLWLIDDALAFLPYISSDRSLHGKGRKLGDKVSDLIFFDDSMILGDEEGTTVTIVEFKKPSRDDYVFGNAKNDPVMQVIETLEQATAAGGLTKSDGAHLSFAGVVRRFAFVIADLTPSLVRVLKKHDFKNDWNPKIWVKYRDNESIFIQVLGYETLIESAKKRNQAFFSVLLGE
ncbi:MAG: ATP-binding protein [Alphaproteobacteria bacterium]|nr:ATP-binding protein [Alphaproteobacteria bacterium]